MFLLLRNSKELLALMMMSLMLLSMMKLKKPLMMTLWNPFLQHETGYTRRQRVTVSYNKEDRDNKQVKKLRPTKRLRRHAPVEASPLACN